MLRAAVALKMLTQMSSVATSGPLGPQNDPTDRDHRSAKASAR